MDQRLLALCRSISAEIERRKMTTSTLASQEKGSFFRDGEGRILPTVENFYKFCAEGKLMSVQCRRCRAIAFPPRTICPKCFADEFEWIQLKDRGKLLTYTIIHFPPSIFQALAPYAVGIVKLDDGPQLPGMVKNVKLQELRIGMELQVDFETALPKEWPKWSRYFFRPLS